MSAFTFFASAALLAVRPAATNCRDSAIHFLRSLPREPAVNKFPDSAKVTAARETAVHSSSFFGAPRPTLKMASEAGLIIAS